MDLSRFVALIARRIWLIALVTLLAGGIAYLVSGSLPVAYQSDAKVLVGSLTETRTDQLTAFQQLAQTYAELATSTPVLSRVIDRLGLSEDPAQLASRVDVRASAGQPIVDIVAVAPSGPEAAQLAQALAGEVTQMATPSGEGAASLASIVQPAAIPKDPSSPRVLLNTVVAGALGLALSIGLVLLLAGGSAAASSKDRLDAARAF